MEPAAGRCGLAGDVTRPPCDPSDRTETGHEGDDGGRTVECAPTRAGRLPRRPFPAAALARLHAFRASLHATFTRRADALLDLADALLSAPGPVWSLPQLSLQPAHRRGWGSTYAALARGRIDPERLRDLLVSSLPVADPLVFAVDVTTWPRCDAECSPARGYYYHPSRHSAGQPIIAGWAYQWVCQLGFERDSWTAPVDARRLDPLDDTDRTAAAQVRPLLLRRPATAPTWRHRPAAPPRRQARLRRPHHLAGSDRHLGRKRRAVRHRDRAGLGGAASHPAAPPRPRLGRATPDRARHHPARGCRARPRPHAPAEGGVAVVGRPARLHPRPGPGLAGVRAPLRPGAHHPLRQADPRLGHPTAPPRATQPSRSPPRDPARSQARPPRPPERSDWHDSAADIVNGRPWHARPPG